MKYTYDYFISGRWRNRDNVLDLTNKIRAKGKKVYCFLEADHSKERVKDDPEASMQAFEKLDWKTDLYVRKVFNNDMNAQRESENFVLLLPAGKSAHIEAGASYGMGRKCILVGEQTEAESLYLIFDEVYSDVKSFLESI